MSGADPLSGRTLAERYRVAELLARGGMARVYRARDERLDRDVALKVLSRPYADDPAFTARFLGEARAAASLTHPSLVHVYDSGSDGDAHFIVMELLDRHRSLRHVLNERGRLGSDEVQRIGRELLAGLGAVHDRGLVHCDVKAGNVMLGEGPAKLIDFGIATAPHDGAKAGTSIGSLPYMSPEQLHGRAMSPASDLFSLGVVLYEALTGRQPYVGETPEAMSGAHAARAAVPPSAVLGRDVGPLDEAIMQALRTDPVTRFSSATAMASALSDAPSAPVGSRDEETHVMRRAATVSPPIRVPAAASPGGVPRAVGGTLAVLAAAAIVLVLVVLPLLDPARDGAPSTSPSPSVDPGGPTVVVPSLIGSSTQDAIGAAREAGLEWTLYCEENADRPDGIVDQEPPAGTEVARGSPFSLYSARIADCG